MRAGTVVHAGPLVVRLDDPHSTSSSRHVVHCLVQQRVRPAEPWVRELEPTECEQWNYYVAAAVTWLGSRGLQMCDITVSNLGLEGEDGTLMLFDLAGWSITGAPAWGGGSGFMSYLQSRCPAVLSVIQSHGEVDSAKCLQIWASELGLSANCWLQWYGHSPRWTTPPGQTEAPTELAT